MTQDSGLILPRPLLTARINNKVAGRLPLSAMRPVDLEIPVSRGPIAKPPPRPPEGVRSSGRLPRQSLVRKPCLRNFGAHSRSSTSGGGWCHVAPALGPQTIFATSSSLRHPAVGPIRKGSGRSRSLGRCRRGERGSSPPAVAYGWMSAPKAPRMIPRSLSTPNTPPVSSQVPMMPSGPSWSWPTNMPSTLEARFASVPWTFT